MRVWIFDDTVARGRGDHGAREMAAHTRARGMAGNGCPAPWPVRELDAASGMFRVITQGDAEQDAAAAAARASVVMGEVDTVAGLRGAADLFARIWEIPAVPPMPHDVLRSLVHAGGRVHAAFRDGQLVGAAVAVFSAPPMPHATR